MKSLGIIPARYASTRLPGKALVDIGGRPMIEHVYRRASPVFDHLVVATDDARIAEVVRNFGGTAILTNPEHSTGTNRCLEAYQKWSAAQGPVEVIVNIQGDEPLVEAEDLRRLVALFAEPATEMGTLVKAISSEAELQNTTGCFAVLSQQHEALYFSRQLIPFLRDVPRSEWLQHHTFYKHLGLYGYRPSALERFAHLGSSPLEIAEALEQNRWLENGGRIMVAFAQKDSHSVDTAADLEKVRQLYAQRHD